MCAPRVTRHTSIRYSSSRHTRVNMGASIFFTAAIIRAFRSARSRGLVCRRVLRVLCTKCTMNSNHRLTRVGWNDRGLLQFGCSVFKHGPWKTCHRVVVMAVGHWKLYAPVGLLLDDPYHSDNMVDNGFGLRVSLLLRIGFRTSCATPKRNASDLFSG